MTRFAFLSVTALTALTLLTACAGAWKGPMPGTDHEPIGKPPPPPEKKNTVVVAAVQTSSELGAVDANRAKLTKLVEEAAAHGAKFVVLPEASITGYLSQDMKTTWARAGWPIDKGFAAKDPAPFAETVPGPSSRHFTALSRKLGVYITVPLVEVEEGGQPPTAKPETIALDPAAAKVKTTGPRFYNTALLAAPDGRIVAHYRKLHPWPHPEQSWASPGDHGVQVVETPYGRVGLAICYDIHDVLELYKPHDLWALLYPIAWVDDADSPWFPSKLGERLAPFHHHLVGANWSIDAPVTWHGYGQSLILGPDGKALARATTEVGSEIVYAAIPVAAEVRPAP